MKYFFLEQFEHNLGANISDLLDPIFREKENIEPIEMEINGKTRKIFPLASQTKMYTLQKKINNFFLNDENFPDSVYGYRKNKSFIDYLYPHCGNIYFLKIDLKNFFGSINIENFDLFFNDKVKINDEDQQNQVLMFLRELLFIDGELPQGFITSPTLSNIYFKRADLRIEKYCLLHEITYTRYADDIILSSKYNVFKGTKVLSTISAIVKDFDLSINFKKTRKAKNELPISGFVIGTEVRLSKKKLSKLKNMLFLIENNHHKNSLNIILAKEFGKKYYYMDNILSYLSGMRAFLISSIKKNNEPTNWAIKSSKTILRIEKVIKIIYKRTNQV